MRIFFNFRNLTKGIMLLLRMIKTEYVDVSLNMQKKFMYVMVGIFSDRSQILLDAF